MFNTDTTEISSKVSKNLKKSEAQPNSMVVCMEGSTTSVIGKDVNDPDGLSALIIARAKEGFFVAGHSCSKSFCHSTIDGILVDCLSKKYISINGRKKENIKFHYFDANGFGIEISSSSQLSKGEMVLCFIETNGEVIFYLASSGVFDCGQSISLTSSTTASSMLLLRNIAFEMLAFISPDTMNEINTYFKSTN